jgi:hypothetical protein
LNSAACVFGCLPWLSNPLTGGPPSQRRTSRALGLAGGPGASTRNLRRRSSLASRFFVDSDSQAAEAVDSEPTSEGARAMSSRTQAGSMFPDSVSTHELEHTLASLPQATTGEELAAATVTPSSSSLPPGATGVSLTLAGSESTPGQPSFLTSSQPQTQLEAQAGTGAMPALVSSVERDDASVIGGPLGNQRQAQAQAEPIHHDASIGSRSVHSSGRRLDVTVSGRSARVLTMRKPT